MTNKLSSFFGGRAFWSVAMRLTIPVALQNLLTCSFSLVDTLMIGRLGDLSLSAVGMAGQWSWLMGVFLFGFYSGSSVFFAQYWGAGDTRSIRRVAGIMFAHMIGITAVFTIAAAAAPRLIIGIFNDSPEVADAGAGYLRIAAWSYLAVGLSNGMAALLRSTEEVRLPMAASMISAAANVALNRLLIFGGAGLPAMGVRGAAAATVISAWIAPAVMLMVSLKRKNIMVTEVGEMLRFDRKLLAKYYRISLPVAANESLWGLGTMIYNVIFARIGYEEFAAVTMERTVENVAFSAALGLCSAASVMIGMRIGAGDTEEGVRTAERFLILIPISQMIISAAVIAFREPIIGLFSGSAGSISEYTAGCAAQIMLIYFIEYPLRMIQYILIVGVFRAGGDTRTGMIFDTVSVWVMAIPVMSVTAFLLRWPLWAVYISMLVSEDWLKAAACLIHFRSRKWIKPVTGDNTAG